MLVFYLQVPLQLRNYGGGTSKHALVHLAGTVLATDAHTSHRHLPETLNKIIALALLAISIGSAMYALDHPWQEPWLFKLLEHLNWINYTR